MPIVTEVDLGPGDIVLDGQMWPQQTWAQNRGAAVPLSRTAVPHVIHYGPGRGLLLY